MGYIILNADGERVRFARKLVHARVIASYIKGSKIHRLKRLN